MVEFNSLEFSNLISNFQQILFSFFDDARSVLVIIFQP